MRRLTLTLLSFLTFLTLILVLSACSETNTTTGISNNVGVETGNVCNHVEETIEGITPTCTNTGLTEGKKCTLCDEITLPQFTIPAAGHTEIIIDGKEPTCTNTGLTEGKRCTLCDEITLPQYTIPATGHTEETIEGKEPTCTDTGLTEGKKCTLCDEITLPQTIIPAAGHIEIVIDGKEPNCTEAGLTEGKKCIICNAVTVEQNEIATKGHTFSNIYEFETSCGGSNISYSAQICNNCGYSKISGEETVLHPHDFECYSREATCTLEGITNGFRCKNCSYIATETRVEALGHSFGEYINNDTNHYQECSRCKLKNYEAHNCEEFTTVKEPNCYEEGREVGVCVHCDSEVENNLPIKHLWNNGTTITEATCTSKGEMLYTCTICGATKTEEINETSHLYDDGVITRKPTCVNVGERLHACKSCGATKITSVPMTEHPYNDGVITKEPNCTESGSKLYTCTYCSAKKAESVSSLGHDWDDGITTQEANCYQTGNIHYLCKRCGAEKDTSVSKKHSFDNGTVIQEASCTQIGKICYTCTICGVYDDVTTSIKHNTSYVSAKEETCTEDGCKSHYYCSDCQTYYTIVNSSLNRFEYDERMYATYYTYSYTLTTFADINIPKKGHDFSGSYEKTEEKHYLLCKNSCGVRSNEATHTFVEETAFERTNDGTQYIYSYNSYLVCHTCDYREIVDSLEFTHEHYGVEIINGAEPTCAQNGITTGLACSVVGCDEIYIEQKTIPALGHNYVDAICTRCGLNSKLGTPGLTYELNPDGTAYILTGIGTATTPFIVIGSEYNGLPVTEIKSSAFSKNYDIISIVIPPTITTIGNNAFYECQKLVEVYNLSSLTITNDATNGYVGKYAFDIYTDLSAQSNLVTTNKGYIFYLGETNYLMGYVGNETELIFPNIFIGKEYSIYDYAFYYNRKITSITIGLKTKAIGNNAFESCYYLTEINFNAIAMDNLSSNNNAFYGAGSSGTGIKVMVGKNVTKIPSYLFRSSYSPKITNVEFEEKSACESIGELSFSNCKYLVNMEIPNSVTSIGDDAFDGCNSLAYNEYDNGYYLGNEINPYLFLMKAKDKLITSCTIHENTKFIYQWAFYSCTSLTSVTIGNNVTLIENHAFRGCTSLTKVTIENSVTSIGEGAFAYCTSLTSITIPDSVVSIGSDSFKNCSSLKELIIGNGVTTLPEGLLCGCSNLESLTIPFVGGSKKATSVSASTFFGYIFGTSSYTNGINVSQHSSGPFLSSSSYYCYIPSTLKYVTVTGGNILNGAFYNCSNLTNIELPINLTSIKDYVFYNCTSLTSVTIPNDIKLIGSYAFYNCTSLASVAIGNSVTSIGDYAFYNCTSLASVAIGNSVTSIKEYAFYDCTALTEINFNATAMNDLSDYNYVFSNAGKDGEGIKVTIGKNVTKIPAHLFHPCYGSYSPKITSVVFEQESVCESIENYAFYGCYSLASITIPNSVTSIGNYTFYGCNSLASITIPNSVTLIGSYAFRGCTSLASVTIGNSVKSIGNAAFYYCTSLTEINFNAAAMNDLSSNNDVFYEAGKDGDGIKVTIGKNVTKIPDYLFYSYSLYSSKITSVEFEEGSVCESIGNYAFYICDSLTSIIIPNSVTSIGNCAFHGCTSLANVTMSNNVTMIGNSAFGGCTALTSIAIPDSVISIGDNAFFACTSLTNVTIPNSIKSIGYEAFYNCTALAEINFNATSMDDLSEENYVFYNAGKDRDGIKVTIGKNVTKIPAYLFQPRNDSSCSPKITSVVFEEESVCESIGNYAFAYCTSLASIIISNSVISIGECAFYGCTALTNITIPNCIREISGWAFSNCTSLTEVYISDIASWCNISFGTVANPLCNGANLYVNNELVSELEIPNTVTEIKAYAFYNCISLTSITIPNSVTSIGKYAFYNYTSLAKVNYLGSVEEWCNITFADYTSNPLYYAKNLYMNDELVTELVIPDTVTEIKSYTFCKCTSLTSITLSNSVISIGEYAFFNCIGLTNITIPESVVSIGKCAFYDCNALTNLTFENTNGWYITQTEGAPSGTSIDVTNTSTNASNLKSTRLYCKYYWYRKTTE